MNMTLRKTLLDEGCLTPSEMPRGQLAIKLLGEPQLQAADGSVVSLPGRKPLALLAYLCQSPGMLASRSKLADMLWGDRDEDHARNNLRQTLAVLRRDLSAYDAELIISDGDKLHIKPGSVACDTHRFADLSRKGAVDLEQAARLYQGPFLDGFFAGSSEYEDWASGERDRLSHVAVTVLERLARGTEGGNGLDYARRLLVVEPLREASHRLLMERLAAMGDHDMALRQYDSCKAILLKEYGVPPDAETDRLRERILQARKSWNSSAAKAAKLSERTKEATETRVSVEVQRFACLGGGADEEIFAMGLAQALIGDLSADRDIVVRSGKPGQTLESVQVNSAEGSGRSGLAFTLGGSVQPTRTGLRVNVQLIDRVTGDLVWADRHDSEATLDSQTQLSSSIVSAVQLEMMLSKFNLRDRAPPDSPVVRHLVNRAIVNFFQQTKDSVAKAIKLAEEALALDPDSVRGRRTLSAAISAGISLGALPCTDGNVDRALALAESVVLVAPNDEIARCELAWALSNAGRHAEAADQLRHAIDLNPRSPNARGDLAEQLALLGRSAEAIEELDAAFAMSGYDPLEFWRQSTIATARFAMGSYSETLDVARQLVRAKPAFLRGVVFWAAAAAADGHVDEARKAIGHLRGLAPDIRLENLIPAYFTRYVQDDHHQRLLTMLRKAGLPD